MSVEKNTQIVKDFLAALGRRDKQGLLALPAEDIVWIIPGEWQLAGIAGVTVGLFVLGWLLAGAINSIV